MPTMGVHSSRSATSASPWPISTRMSINASSGWGKASSWPVSVQGMGGRQVRTGKEFGEIWALKWANLLMVKTTNEVSYKSMFLYSNWLTNQIGELTYAEWNAMADVLNRIRGPFNVSSPVKPVCDANRARVLGRGRRPCARWEG